MSVNCANLQLGNIVKPKVAYMVEFSLEVEKYPNWVFSGTIYANEDTDWKTYFHLASATISNNGQELLHVMVKNGVEELIYIAPDDLRANLEPALYIDRIMYRADSARLEIEDEKYFCY